MWILIASSIAVKEEEGNLLSLKWVSLQWIEEIYWERILLKMKTGNYLTCKTVEPDACVCRNVGVKAILHMKCSWFILGFLSLSHGRQKIRAVMWPSMWITQTAGIQSGGEALCGSPRFLSANILPTHSSEARQAEIDRIKAESLLGRTAASLQVVSAMLPTESSGVLWCGCASRNWN